MAIGRAFSTAAALIRREEFCDVGASAVLTYVMYAPGGLLPTPQKNRALG
jgi:hypothetical protein